MYSHLFTECGGWDAIKIIWKYICFIAKVHKVTKGKTKEEGEKGWPTGFASLCPLTLWPSAVCADCLFGWKIYVYTFFSFPFTHRESCRAVESGQCYKSDIAVQANNARLQWGGIMQHYKGLAGYCHAVVRNAGIYATARGIFGWVVPRVASTAQSPRCSATLQSCTLIFSQGPGHSIERVEQECVCVCNISAISVYAFAFQSHSLSHIQTHTHTVTALLASYSLIKLHVPTLFSFFDYRTQRSPGYEWSLAGKTTPELYMQEHEPALLRLQAKLSLRAGRKCLILPLTHTNTLTHYLYQLLVFKLGLKTN